MSEPEADPLIAEVGAAWREGVAETGRIDGLVIELVGDWRREMASSKQPDVVLQILRSDAQDLLATTPPAQRVSALEAVVLTRLVDGLAGRTYGLGVAVIDGTIADAAARDAGRALLAEAESLSGRVRTMPPGPARDNVQRTLGQALMEALYAVERQAMSFRLSDYQRSRR